MEFEQVPFHTHPSEVAAPYEGLGFRPFRLRSRASRWGVGLVLTLLTACGRAEPEGGSDEPVRTEAEAPTDPADELAGLGVPNTAAPLPNLVTAAQPSQRQVDELVRRGYDNFISLRLPTEAGAGWEEEHLTAAGSRFARIPISGASDLTREHVEALDELLQEAQSEHTVLYCASSNRVGALLALRAFWMEGADAEDALALGREAGLAGLEPEVRRILEEGQSGGSTQPD